MTKIWGPLEEHIHKKIMARTPEALKWLERKSQNASFPFYASFDLRSSGQKIAPVDANLFPAGFNNVCEVDQSAAPRLVRDFFKKHHPQAQKIILLAEEHTKNAFYWDNIYSLKTLLEQSGPASVCVCAPGRNILKNTVIKSAAGRNISVFLLKNKISTADLIISNNDFSTDYSLDLKIPVIPSPRLGWRHRKKHHFFYHYNQLAAEFALLMDMNPSSLVIQTQRFLGFDVQQPRSLNALKEAASVFLKKLQAQTPPSAPRPFLFLKNNSGTYGLGITVIHSPEDIDQWNSKIKKKMKAAKGGGPVTELIIQEGVGSYLKSAGFTAEPVIYLIGGVLAGGFLRAHKDKGALDNLNSPGAVYRTLCISDLEIEAGAKPMENVYGWTAYLSALALAYELQSLRDKPLGSED